MKILPGIFVILFLFLSTHVVFAQNKANGVEIGVNTGVFSSDYIFDGYTPGFLVTVGKKDYINHQYSGTYFLSIKYFIKERISINFIVAYENESGDWQANYNWDHFRYQTMLIGTFKRQAFSLCPEISIYYSNKKDCRTYCTAGVGLTYRNETDLYSQDYINGGYYNTYDINSTYIQGYNGKIQGNMYFSPLGLSVGNKVCWSIELGIGYKGIVNTGLTVKL